jgi:hypothetical protein
MKVLKVKLTDRDTGKEKELHNLLRSNNYRMYWKLLLETSCKLLNTDLEADFIIS